MSSLTIDKSGKTVGYNIQWFEDGHRYTIYLGGRWYSKKTAEACQECIDALLYYKRNSIITPDRKIEDWLQSAPAHLLSKLAKAGLYSRLRKSHIVLFNPDCGVEKRSYNLQR